jgi:uncharacterized protein (DUF2141 family)
MKSLLCLTIALLSFAQNPAHADGVDLTITFQQVSNSVGQIYYALYASDTDYQNESNSAYQGIIPATPGDVVTVAHNITPATYALTAFHDENGNGELDTGAFGIPKEQFGLSNIFNRLWSKPSFSDLSFDISATAPNAINILMKMH